MLKSIIDKATSFEKRFENIGTVVYQDSTSASNAIALEIASLIKVKQSQKQPCILGLATGSSPKGLYAELVRLHKEEGLSFKNVVSFNLDESISPYNDIIIVRGIGVADISKTSALEPPFFAKLFFDFSITTEFFP